MAEDNVNPPPSKSGVDSSILGKLPRFDGKTSIKKFLKSINKRSNLEKWTEDEKTAVVKYLCTGFAETYIDSHPGLEDCSYDELCDQLITRFTPKLTTSDAYAQLLSVKQNRRSVTDFAENIETVAANISDAIEDLSDPDKRSELLISVFLSGLDPHLKRLLTISEFEDFTELLRTAKRCEETFIDSRRNVGALEQHSPSQSVRQQPRYEQHNHRPDIICYGCGKRGHIQRNCWSKFPPMPRYPPNFTPRPRFNNSYQKN